MPLAALLATEEAARMSRVVGEVAARLSGSDLRSIGRADAVSSEILRRPSLAAEAVRLLSDSDAVLRARAADALEKAARVSPSIVRPHRRRLLRLLENVTQQEVRWHLAQLMPRLQLTPRERSRVLAVLRRYLDDPSRIVQVCAMQGLWELTEDGSREPWIRLWVQRAATHAAPSIRARARRLLSRPGSCIRLGSRES